jgi:hypothetical protein
MGEVSRKFRKFRNDESFETFKKRIGFVVSPKDRMGEVSRKFRKFRNGESFKKRIVLKLWEYGLDGSKNN